MHTKLNELHEIISVKFERELSRKKILYDEDIIKILSEAVGIDFSENSSALKPLWWAFVTPNYYISVNVCNGKHVSYMNKYDRNLTKKLFEYYKKDIEVRLYNSEHIL